jgi:murein DD-endopeptidase MepM/ murein hydrolase activator NlpD
MILRKIIMLGLLGIVPVSCNAAPTQTPQKAVAPVVKTAPVSVAARTAPLSLGAFKLDRRPRQGGLALGFVPPGTKRLVVDGADIGFGPDGRFIVGFGRDYKASASFAAFLDSGQTVTEKLPVSPHPWKIENLAQLPHHSQPDAEFQARRPAELAQINAARRMTVSSEGWRQAFRWPAKGRISGLFGSQRIYAGEPGAPHSGVDVAGGIGEPVTAPADGVVILAAASSFTLEGNLLMIDHGMGLNSAFLHLSKINVRKGDVVRQGQLVGAIGKTGRATGPHLHWGMKWQNERIDPQQLAGPM